jgi:hypothetical protein
MFTVLSRPYDDDDIVEVYIAEHTDQSTNPQTQADFELAWKVTRDKILEKDAEYNVSDIIKSLERKGWQIIRVTPAKVTY